MLQRLSPQLLPALQFRETEDLRVGGTHLRDQSPSFPFYRMRNLGWTGSVTSLRGSIPSHSNIRWLSISLGIVRAFLTSGLFS